MSYKSAAFQVIVQFRPSPGLLLRMTVLPRFVTVGVVALVLSAVLELHPVWVEANDGTNFFLKASKSVPRIGRRMDNDFLKASKSVPRIGRRRESVDDYPYQGQGPAKRMYADKDFGAGEALWGAEHGFKDAGLMLGDEPYRDMSYHYQDVYMPQ